MYIPIQGVSKTVIRLLCWEPEGSEGRVKATTAQSCKLATQEIGVQCLEMCMILETCNCYVLQQGVPSLSLPQGNHHLADSEPLHGAVSGLSDICTKLRD